MREVAGILSDLKIRHCLTGDLALRHWGLARDSSKADVLIWAGFGQEEELCAAILSYSSYSSFSVVSAVRDPIAFTREFRVLPLRSPDGLLINLNFGALSFEETVLDRAVEADPMPVASAEDLLLLKLFTLRPSDLADARALTAAQRGRLQWPYVDFWLPQLAELKDDARIIAALDSIRAKHI